MYIPDKTGGARRPLHSALDGSGRIETLGALSSWVNARSLGFRFVGFQTSASRLRISSWLGAYCLLVLYGFLASLASWLFGL